MSIYQKIANIQDKILNIPKDGKNPHFSNTYATYEQVMEVLHPLLREQRLMVCHSFKTLTPTEGVIGVTTKIVDIPKDVQVEVGGKEEVEMIETTLFIPMTKNDPQMAGSAITYAKRYSVLAMFGLGTEDDDGEKATTSPKPTTAPKQAEDYDATENALCRVHQNPDGSAVVMKHYQNDKGEWWSHQTADGKWCNGRATKYNKDYSQYPQTIEEIL